VGVLSRGTKSNNHREYRGRKGRVKGFPAVNPAVEVASTARTRSLLVELAPHQRFQFVHRLLGMLALGVDMEFAAGTGGEHHHPHNALAINDLAVFFDENLTPKAVRGLHEESRGARVHAQLVGNDQFPGNFRVISSFATRTHEL
jgi:hypothetical protein